MNSKPVSAMMLAYEKKPPTMKHRPILTFGILGTVYAVSPAGEVRYFDYDWDAALEFAGVTAATVDEWRALDLRLGKPKHSRYLPNHDMWHPERVVRTTDRAYWILNNELKEGL